MHEMWLFYDNKTSIYLPSFANNYVLSERMLQMLLEFTLQREAPIVGSSYDNELEDVSYLSTKQFHSTRPNNYP